MQTNVLIIGGGLSGLALADHLLGGMMFDRHGSYAEYITVKRQNVIAIDSPIDLQTLATLPEAYLTAWGALDYNLRIEPGETLLVRGGTSTVGIAAITYAKARGLQVIATTRQAARRDELHALGADHVLIDDGPLTDAVKGIVPRGADKAIELVTATALVAGCAAKTAPIPTAARR